MAEPIIFGWEQWSDKRRTDWCRDAIEKLSDKLKQHDTALDDLYVQIAALKSKKG